ncbi:MAG: cell division protein ZapA [bacterium]|nr:cell division protein ZapA [bacterium]
MTIKLAGKEYRLRSSASEPWLQQVAGYVDQAMQQVKERTDTVDSLDIALLTALNLAREVLYLREQAEASAETASDLSDVRLRSLIEQIESELPLTDSGPS